MKTQNTLARRLLAVTSLLLICAMLFASCNVEGSQPTEPSTPTETPNHTNESKPTDNGSTDKETDEGNDQTEPHVHDWSDWTVTTEPTCADKGEQKRECACGEVEKKAVDALGHNFGEWQTTTEPTCTDKGEQKRECACGEVETQAIDANGHTYTSVVTAPTCTEQGYTTYTCHCGDTYTDDYVDATGHNFGEWYTVTSATCTVASTERRDCKNCDHYETKSEKASGHSYTSTVTAPTCTKKGYTTHTCDCGYSYKDTYVDAPGHSFGKWYTVTPATCTVNGTERRDCKNCDHYEAKSEKAPGHSYTSTVTAPTCTKKGYTTHTCDCGYSYKDTYVAATGHSYMSVVTAPTATENGYATHTCDCGISYTETIIPTDFTITSSNRAMIGYIGEANENLVIPAVFENNGVWYRVTAIGDWAFSSCSILTSIVIPDSVTSIGGYAFRNCSSLMSITIPDSVTIIDSSAFSGCSSLTSITIPDSVTSIGGYAFRNCSSLMSITIPDSVTSIGEWAFRNCSSLTSVTIGNSVTSIGDSAFYNCSSLTSINIPDSVTSIGEGAFERCSSLTKITIPDSVTSIGDHAFDHCISFTSVTIGNSVTSIGEYAFYWCSNLTSITIPDSVTSIGWGAFYDCSSLETVYYSGTSAQWSEITIGLANAPLKSAMLYFYSETHPTEEGNYWHYVDGVPTGWKHKHIYTSIVTAPTCDEKGYTTYTCTCGDTYKDNYVNANGHTEVVDNAVGATCTKTGLTEGKHCSVCNKILVSQNIVPVSPHTEGKWIVDKEPTATNTGSKHTECTVCGKRLQEEIILAGYIITWKNNDGTILKTTQCEAGKMPSFGDGVPTKESDSQYSYTFDRWATEIKAATEDATYIALYTKQARTSYIVSYNANGGTNAPSSQNKTAGTSIQLTSTIPVCEGKVFVGWICANDDKVYKSGASFNIDADVTLYAVWGHQCETCHGEGEVSTTNTCSNCSGSGKVTTSSQKWVGCWSCSGIGSISISYTGVCSSCGGWGGRVLCECRCGFKWWADQTGSRTCSRCGRNVLGTKITTCSTCNGTGKQKKTSTSTCDACSGYGGKYVTASSTNTCSSCSGSGTRLTLKTCSSCDGDKIFADSYSSHTITLKDNSSTIGTWSVTLNSPYKLTVPTKTGYTFMGWFDSAENGTQYTDGEGVCLSVWSESGNKTLYARWSLNYYTITYDCDESVDISGMPTLYTVEDEDFTLREQYKNHQTITWKLVNTTITSVDTSIAKDIIIKGIWVSTASAPVVENRVEPTHCIDGHYDRVIYCGRCSVELLRETITILASHTPKSAEEENRVEATCGTNGAYDAVIYCALCNKELSREAITIPATNNHNIVKGTCTVCGYEYFSSGLEFTSNGNGTCYVSGIGNCADKDIYIPRVSPYGYSVTSIGSYAFNGRERLTSITIPDSVTSIGEYAFWGCSNLRSVTIGNSVTSIGSSAFDGCSSLTRITIPDSVTSIGNGAFCACSSLTSITIPDSVTSIGNSAFFYCSSLTSITIPGSVTKIGWTAFSGCSGLTGINIPDSVTSIGDSAFSGCSSLESIIVESNNPKYYSQGNCLIEKDTNTLISGCKNSVIPDSVTNIGKYAFDGCISLTGINIPDSVTRIGYAAFYGCKSLTSINIPNSVISIGQVAFDGCTSLTSITFEGTVAECIHISFGKNWNDSVPATEVICSNGTVKLK